MSETWEILEKELMFHGFRLLGNQRCQFTHSNKKEIESTIKAAIQFVNIQIKENKKLFSELWSDAASLLSTASTELKYVSEPSVNLFVYSLEGLGQLLSCFNDLENTELSKAINIALQKDINNFDNNQINKLPNYKISIDWIHRLISHLIYLRSLLQFASYGPRNVNSIKIKTARSVSGPWANLDLGMRERVYGWWEEADNFRGRDRDIRNQARYKKGLQAYNNNGSVGEGHYWREQRNEPFSWYDRNEEDPYPHRYTLTRN